MNKFLLFFLFLNLNLAGQVTNNTLYAWGDNSLGQLGDSTLVNKNLPVEIGKRHNWRQISSGLRHTMAIKNDGSLWAFGDNFYGELGIGSYSINDGTPRYRDKPVRVGFENDWKQVDAEGVFTIAIKNDGSLWGWGNNYEGQLGIGTITGNTPYGWTTPQRIGNSNDWKKISAGNQHVVALKNDGTLWTWGNNNFGQLGDGTGINKLVPTQIGSDNDWKEIDAGLGNSLAIKNNGTLWTSGAYQSVGFNTFTQLGTDADWKTVSTGQFAWTAIKVDGSLWFLRFRPGIEGGGFNPQKETTSSDWSQISVGYWHAAAIKKDSTLWTWGRNVEGQLGSGSNGNQTNPIQVGTGQKWVQASTCEFSTTALEYDCTPLAPPSVSNLTYYKHEPALPLTAGGSNLRWYTDPTSDMGAATAFIPSNSVVGYTPYYVTQTINSCETQAAEIKVGTLPCDGSKECLDRVALYVGFDFEIQGRTVGFFNRSKATTYSWDFGDNTASSAETSPTYEYINAGGYNVRLIANNANNQRDTAIHLLKVQGINSVTPNRGGIGSYVSVNLDGYGFDANSRIFMKSTTGQIVSPEEIKVNSISKATAIFSIPSTAQMGVYDVIASINGISDTLKQGFELQTSEPPIFNVNLVGPTTIRTGVKRNFSIVVKNLSNTDAFMVPLYLTGIPKIADVKLLNPISYELPPILATDPKVIELFASTNIEILKSPIKYDTLNDNKYAFLLLPLIQAESSINVDFEFTIPLIQTQNGIIDFSLNYETFPPIFSNSTSLFSNINARQSTSLQVRSVECNRMEVLLNCGDLLVDIVPNPLPSDCKIEVIQLLTKQRFNDFTVRDASTDLGSVTAKCLKDLKGPEKLVLFTKGIAKKYDLLSKGIKTLKCLSNFGECILDGLEDTDKDGFPDLSDACPTVWGKSWRTPGKRGCPDLDKGSGDGYADNIEDLCPNEPSNYCNGCPCPPKTGDKNRDAPPSPKREGNHSMKAGNSVDPNAKYVSGWGADNISKSRNLAYTITFENLPSAAFAAQKVVVKDTLDKTKLNVATFRFLGYGFSDKSFIVDEHKQFFQLIDLRPTITAKLAVKGSLDEERGIVTWEFSTLNATTLKEIEDDLIGFLPPNTTSPEGEGFVSFSIDVMPTFKTGDAVVNKSSIIFDNNPAIVTNEVSAKIDEIAPQSQMSLVSIATNKDSVILSIAGTDIISGIRNYDIFRSVNDSTYEFIETTDKSTLKYAVTSGKKYKFYSIATDNVGNLELAPSQADVTFTIEALVYDCPVLSKNVGDVCDDGNIATIEDKITTNCECKGTPKPKDCPSLNLNIGDTCDDGYANTINDKVQADCTCKGSPVSSNITVSCPDNITTTAAIGQTSAIINYTEPTGNSTCPIGVVNILPDANNLISGSAFEVGTKTLTFTASDDCGNTKTCSFTVTVNPAPTGVLTLNCPTNITVTAEVGKTSAIINYPTPTASSTCPIGAVKITPNDANPASGSSFEVGTKTLSFIATDECGNSKTCSFTITINPAPKDVLTFNCPSNITVNAAAGQTTAKVTYTVPTSTSTCPIGTVKITADAANLASGSAFPIGTKTLSFTATDGCGNTQICSFNIVVIAANTCANDTEKPVIKNCPTNISVTTKSTCAKVEWKKPFITDNCCDPSVAITSAPTNGLKSGSCFPIGTTTVTYTVTDPKGNKTTCIFTVTVTKVIDPCDNDTEKPVIKNCPANINLTTTNSCKTVTWPKLEFTDNCCKPSVSTTSAPTRNLQNGSCFPIGTTTMTVTAIDLKGNKAACSFSVTIKKIADPCDTDREKPVFKNCPSNITLTTTSTCAKANWTAPTATDNCCSPSVSSNYNSGYCFPIGITTVKYSAKDKKGNEATCSFTVTVTAANTCVTTFNSNKCYKIVNKKSGKVLGVLNSGNSDRTAIVQNTFKNTSNQKWQFISLSNNMAKVKSTSSNKYLACDEAYQGADIYQLSYNRDTKKDWIIECLDNDFISIKHKFSGKYITVENSSVADKASIEILTWKNDDSQKWQIVETPCSNSSSLLSNSIFTTQGNAVLNKIRLNWFENTAQQGEVFIIEKERKGIFERLDIVKAIQDVGIRSYVTYDNNPNEGKNIYQISLLRNDGSIVQSLLIEVNMDKIVFAQVYPNPTDSDIDILLNNPSEDESIVRVYNILGVEVQQQTYKSLISTMHLKLGALPSGLYQLHVSQKGKRDFVKQIVIQR